MKYQQGVYVNPFAAQLQYMMDNLEGKCGTAKRCQYDKEKAAKSGILTVWMLTMPGAHPMWRDYLMTVVHLRELPGVPKAKPEYIGATHEIIICPLLANPEYQAGMVPGYTIMNPNILVQFGPTHDKGATEVTNLVARACVDGIMWPEVEGVVGGLDSWRKSIRMAAQHFPLESGHCPKCGEITVYEPDGNIVCASVRCDYEKPKDQEAVK